MNRSVGENLISLVALTGQQHQVARAGFFERFANRQRAVGFDDRLSYRCGESPPERRS
jgi:hypothetical protein